NGLGNAIRGKLILIAGGVGKGQDFTPLSAPLLKFGKTLVLIGEDGPKIGAAVADGVQKVQATTLRDAIEKAKALAADGDAVLLSPACASFDMFKNYEDRGQQFVATVKDVVGAR
ncbi:MAG: UDP-N-acetylmuramoyl-L-alanine--D-glutamate ligase, partial [Moraxellaceae bacterium]|nr:UDP-N-acetylmuramoyl-L-alanine--D-glutamate ligase [Moraxellaceae bacterium]